MELGSESSSLSSTSSSSSSEPASAASATPMRKNYSGPNLYARNPLKYSQKILASPVFRRLASGGRSAPLAYAEDDSSIGAHSGADPPSPPPPPNDASAPRKNSKFARFRLPPPLKLAKKKSSCPSLLPPNNAAATPPKSSAEAPPALTLIRNELAAASSAPPSASPVAAKSDSFPFPGEDSGEDDDSRRKESLSRRFHLLKDGTLGVCRLEHPRTVIGKLSSSKLLRRWEQHCVLLRPDCITSSTPSGALERSIDYGDIEDVTAMPNLEGSEKFCLRIGLPDGSLLLQTKAAWIRREWEASILWRREVGRARAVVLGSTHPELILKETAGLVELAAEVGLQDEAVGLEPVALVAALLEQVYAGKQCRSLLDPLISCVAVLLESVAAVAHIAPLLARYAEECPRSRLIDDVFIRVAHQALKKNMDFGKYPSVRGFVQNFLLALSGKNDGLAKVTEFVNTAHGVGYSCPHPRVLPNLVSAGLAGLQAAFPASPSASSVDHRLDCFSHLIFAMASWEDWRVQLGSILQPLPFPESAVTSGSLVRSLGGTLELLASDGRCEVHRALLPLREGKEGWLGLVCPGSASCFDDGRLFMAALETLLGCCCRRKNFLTSLMGMLGPLQLLALRERGPAMDALSLMLELDVVQSEDLALQVTTALTSTPTGKALYASLLDRQIALRNLQEAGGPRKLTLPSRSTDSDLAVLLSSGSFGNLEWLSLAFTNITSRCAEYLIRLPSLRYLNLWSTQFGDAGIGQISEHLNRLQVLNLCETPVTDKGLTQLASLKNLRKLNLNSTQLSIQTFHFLREELPLLQEVDIRYTEAWCAES